MSHLELQTNRPMRTMLTGLSIGLLAVVALGIAKPLPVHATTHASAYLVFYCASAGPPAHPDRVYVEGTNQNNQYVAHQFPAYYTYDNGYWWWAVDYYVYYTATKNGRSVSGSFLVYGPDGRTDSVGAWVC